MKVTLSLCLFYLSFVDMGFASFLPNIAESIFSLLESGADTEPEIIEQVEVICLFWLHFIYIYIYIDILIRSKKFIIHEATNTKLMTRCHQDKRADQHLIKPEN